jgi:cyclic-di-GMP-binding protein
MYLRFMGGRIMASRPRVASSFQRRYNLPDSIGSPENKMADSSFDVVSRVDVQEVKNAVDQATREIANRYDFKNSVSEVELEGELLKLHSDDEYRMKALVDILQGKLVKRGVSLKSLEYGKIEPASRGTVRQEVRLKQGLEQDVARQVVKLIKDSGRKVQAQMQGDQVRVSGKNKDDLQAMIQLLKDADLPVDLQFVNYR